MKMISLKDVLCVKFSLLYVIDRTTKDGYSLIVNPVVISNNMIIEIDYQTITKSIINRTDQLKIYMEKLKRIELNFEKANNMRKIIRCAFITQNKLTKRYFISVCMTEEKNLNLVFDQKI